jgi:hypothetical protein
MSHCLTPTKVAPLAADQAAMLMRDGYLLLRGAVPEAWREPDEASSLIIAGEAGDILVFNADLPHGATRNRSGARRRSLLLSFMPERMRAAQESCRALRNVRMDTSEVFVP